jgi:hypothetical protein
MAKLFQWSSFYKNRKSNWHRKNTSYPHTTGFIKIKVRNESGISLLEVLAALTISTIIIGVVFALFRTEINTFSTLAPTLSVRYDVNSAYQRFTTELYNVQNVTYLSDASGNPITISYDNPTTKKVNIGILITLPVETNGVKYIVYRAPLEYDLTHTSPLDVIANRASISSYLTFTPSDLKLNGPIIKQTYDTNMNLLNSTTFRTFNTNFHYTNFTLKPEDGSPYTSIEVEIKGYSTSDGKTYNSQVMRYKLANS